MSRFHFGVLAAALVLATAGLAACGSSDSSSADQDDITAAIDKAATSGDPAVCTDLQTQNFTAQTSGSGDGGDATAACQKDAESSKADSVDVSNVKVDGDTATADVAITGNDLDGQTLEIGLVKEADQWKLDKVNSFTDFDRAKFTAQFEGQITDDPSTPPAIVTCLKQQFDAATDAQLQALILDPSGGDALFGPCAS
jgi:hypothetical protein